jgi:hypothetical protein
LNKIISNNTIFPTKLVSSDWYAMPVIENYMEELKPKPDKDVLLIIGDGSNVLQDIEEWYKLAAGIEYDTMCVNYSAMICPHPFQHYAAGDAHMPDMQKVAMGLPYGVIKHAWNPGCLYFDVRWVRNGRGGWNGTSANLAFKIGLALDYTRVVLAGCPMDSSGNWYKKLVPENDIKANKTQHEYHLWKWMEIACRPVGRFVRSMSGNTKDILGTPTREWLLHDPETSPEKEDTPCQMIN